MGMGGCVCKSVCVCLCVCCMCMCCVLGVFMLCAIVYVCVFMFNSYLSSFVSMLYGHGRTHDLCGISKCSLESTPKVRSKYVDLGQQLHELLTQNTCFSWYKLCMYNANAVAMAERDKWHQHSCLTQWVQHLK